MQASPTLPAYRTRGHRTRERKTERERRGDKGHVVLTHPQLVPSPELCSVVSPLAGLAGAHQSQSLAGGGGITIKFSFSCPVTQNQ